MPVPTCNRCGTSGAQICAIYDRNLDCTVAWKCEGCGHKWKRDLASILTVADPQAFADVDAKRST